MPTDSATPKWKQYVKHGSIETSYEALKNLDTTELHATDSKGKTALHWAAAYSNIPMIILLRFLGVDTSINDNEGETAAGLATRLGRSTKVTDILADDNYINAVASVHGRTMLHVAYIIGNEEFAADLITAGIDKHILDSDGKQAVEYLIVEEDMDAASPATGDDVAFSAPSAAADGDTLSYAVSQAGPDAVSTLGTQATVLYVGDDAGAG